MVLYIMVWEFTPTTPTRGGNVIYVRDLTGGGGFFGTPTYPYPKRLDMAFNHVKLHFATLHP